MAAFDGVARAAAQKKVLRIAVGSGVFMIAQFGFIFNLVYTVRCG